jgi:hypothetical protein
MLKLAMAAARRNQEPAIAFNSLDCIAHFHKATSRGMPPPCIHSCTPL